MAESETLVDRRQEIFDAVDYLLAMHNDWESDSAAPDYPSELFEEAAEACIGTCESGDVPQDCRDLVKAVEHFADEWRKYKSGHCRRGAIPYSTLWDAYRGVAESCRVAQMPDPIDIPSVGRLFEELKNFAHRDLQIAKTYGVRSEVNGHVRWSGPFFGPNGQVLSDKIRAEADTPGSVLESGWIHPEQLKREQEREQERQQVQAKAANRRASKAAKAKEDPLQLLKEGQYPDVIAKVCGMTEKAVRKMAAANQITVNERDTLSRGQYDPKMDDTPNDIRPTGPPKTTTAAQERKKPGRKPKAVEPEGLSPEALDMIGDLSDGEEHGANEIAQLVSEETGETVSAAQVADVLRERKRGADNS